MGYYRCGHVAFRTDFESDSLEPFSVADSCDGVHFEISRLDKTMDFSDSWSYVDSTEVADVYRGDNGDWAFDFRYRGMRAVMSCEYDRARYWIDGSVDSIAATFLLAMLLQCHIVSRGILVMHAACLEHEGLAFAFTANSGVGKSTRASQWIDSLGCNWISGDRPCIDVQEEILFSGPWDGKEQIFHRVEKPIGSIVEIRRSSSTWVRRLTFDQAFACLMRQLFVPMWDPRLTMKVALLARRLLRSRPMYRLFCDQTSQAALESYEILVRSQDKILKEANDMKMNDGFIVRQELGEYMLMPTGENIATFPGLVVLNQTAAFILEKMKSPICEDDLITLVCDEYDVDRASAKSDLDKLLEQMANLGVVTL